MRLTLTNDAGEELFDWTGDPIHFAASVKEADRVRLCFDIVTPDPKSMARATSKARKELAG